MSYVVSARKYRPRRFSDVVGQDHIVRTLQSALRTDRLAHAFLFCGPRGVGKTTCARILAQTVNCQNPDDKFDPCGECSSCASFEKNASFNIFELDAASNNSVEDIRTLNDQVRFKPQQGRYRVYIIDEVHMLSQSAFNAFLKTLEEPPDHAIFILATTEKHKIIPTILSRCQIFDFKRISVPSMVSHLESICNSENITAETEALVTIAQKSDGALRDALSLFDRLASVMGNKITYKGLVENLNLLDYDVFFKVVDACVREDVRELLKIFDTVVKDGFEGDHFLDGLAGHFRELLVAQDPRTADLQDHSDKLKQRYVNQAALLPASFILSALNIIHEADVSYTQVRNKRLHVEVALSKIGLLNHLVSGTPFPEEKKTPEVAAAPETPEPPPAENDAENIGSEQKEVTAEDPAPQPSPEESAPEEAAPPTDAQVTEDSKRGESPARAPAVIPDLGNITIPQLDDLNKLEEQVAEKERLARENSLELTQENLENWWKEYQTDISSKSVQTTFKATEIRLLDEENIELEVPSPMAQTRIQQEVELLATMRNAFHNQALQIRYKVNRTATDDSTRPKILTNKQKYELLCAKNPSVKTLRDQLDLIVDIDD